MKKGASNLVETKYGTSRLAPMYSTSVTDSQWQVIQELLADQRKRKHDRVAGAITPSYERYLLGS